MLKKFAAWFIWFGLSFLVESWGWTEQGRAFMYIQLGFTILVLLIFFVIVIIAGIKADCALEANAVSLLGILYALAVIVIGLFATWVSTKIFNVDFYVTYQIMTFGQCLCPSNKKKED